MTDHGAMANGSCIRTLESALNTTALEKAREDLSAPGDAGIEVYFGRLEQLADPGNLVTIVRLTARKEPTRPPKCSFQ